MRAPSTLRGKRMDLDESDRSIVVVCHVCGTQFGPFIGHLRRAEAQMRALAHWSTFHHEHDESGCKYPACERPHKAHGLCATHYKRMVRRGDPSVTLKAGRRA